MILNGPGISYTEPDIGAEFVPPIPEHPREAIVKLCEHCTNRLLHRDELLGGQWLDAAVLPLEYLQHEVEFRLRFLQVGDRLLARARLDELVEQPFALDPSFMPADDDAGCTRIGACLTAVAHHGFAQLVVGVLQIVDDDHGDIGEQGRADGLIECVLVAAGRIQVDALGVGPIV